MSSASPLDPRSYHHGDLREALVAAAERLMAEQPGRTFTLREVARVAGVSHNAPYNHFEDRRALQAAVATRGFEHLHAALSAAVASIPATQVEERIVAAACAYVAFGLGSAALFRLMFSADLSGCDDAGLKRAGERAFGTLRSLITQGQEAGVFRDDPDGAHALAAWSLVHGFTTLILDGRVSGPPDAAALEAAASAVASVLLQGVAKRP